ncbi:MAG: hypothetical protein EPN88_10510 [Bacteroidetes bacterium]|nr:MAG: hypothetical protein EPN88_10510 [Bacteroidota bacterium]
MKKKMILLLPLILIELLSNSVAFSQCGGTGFNIGTQWGSKLLVYNCNSTFLCHQFVRLYYESNCEKPTWNNLMNSICSWDPNQYDSPDSYYYDLNTYIKVAEQYANIARYQRRLCGYDHSQVKDSQYPSKYISKYGQDGPVVGHDIHNSTYDISCPGEPSDYTYYYYLGKITGSSQITSTSPVYFSVNSNAGITYSWTVTPLGIVSLSNSSTSNVKVTPIQNGTVTLTLTATTNVGGSISQSKTLTVSIPPSISGNYDNAGYYNQNLLTVNRVSVGGVFIRVSCPGATTYTWQKTSGNINAYLVPGPTASFNMTTGGTITILITAKNGSTTLTSKSVTFYN